MVAIKLENFGGEIPAVDDRLLPDQMAAEAFNTWLFSGRVEPMHALVPLYVPKDPACRSWFRLPKGNSGIDYMSESWWLEFENQNVRVIRSPVAGQDDDGRYYWADGLAPKYMTGTMIQNSSVSPPVQSPLVASGTGGTLPAVTLLFYIVTALTAYGETTGSNEQSVTTPAGPATCSINVSWTAVPGATGYRVYRGQGAPGSENHYFSVTSGTTSLLDTNLPGAVAGTPPVTNTAGATPYLLGIPPPETAPGVTVAGGTTPVETRAYIYTWVSALGEEGPPSPPTVVNGNANGTWNVTMTAPQAGDTANRNLATTRIYRTVTSQQGVATYYFVAEVPIATLTYADSATGAVVVDNGQLTSLYFTPPPHDLQQLVSMPNGMVAGFRKNEVWFCEPYYPHAWPVPYTIAVPNDIVGLGVFNQSLIILCHGQPYSATGVDPSSMALAIIQPLEPCTSMLSIVNTPAGVLYSSPNGLITIVPGGAVNFTLSTITKDQWPTLLNLNSIAAGIVALGYYAYSIATPGVFQDSVTPPDPLNAFQQDAFQQSSTYGTQTGIYQKLDDKRIGLSVLQWSPVTEVQNIITDLFNGEMTVKRDDTIYLFDLRQQPPVANYTWRSKIITLNYVGNLGAAKVYYVTDPSRSSVFRVYAGSAEDIVSAGGLPLRFEQAMTTPGQMFRLPSGFKALYWQFEVEGSLVVTSIHAASSARELRNV
jgi:hypothetical protein